MERDVPCNEPSDTRFIRLPKKGAASSEEVPTLSIPISISKMASSLWLLIGAMVICAVISEVELCSCFYSHPQEHYCSSDFVAVIRVKSKSKGDYGIMAYHIKVKKEFKMTDKARHALSQGLIWTSSHEAACGVTLKPTRYLIAGKVRGDKPFISLCHFVQEWPTLSPKQKKGFRKLYQQGCRCKVRMPNFVRDFREPHCAWETFRDKNDCQSLYSLCVPSHQGPNSTETCSWVSTAQYRRCMKERKYERELEP
ncbi:hypothetical protein JTE90_028779 [Oedothorax gibbosus]|uniref:NTR domain-containing protein n=1 Tax=Oedothorax gibbosus TaxID=931172 RepID=A0AAV6VYB9_9ARAC|nr:hypothetical protein JTE90_028779 [Oedothorax gibbosus]